MKTLLLFTLLCFPAFAQDPPNPQPPTPPAPVIVTIEGPANIKQGDFVDFNVVGGEGDAVKWRIASATNSTTDVPQMREGKGGKRSVEFAYRAGVWTIHVSVFDTATKEIVDDFHTFSVEGTKPPEPDPNPPVIKPLAQLAGDKAHTFELIYKNLLVSIGKAGYTLADYQRDEKASLEEFGLVGHPASVEIAKRSAGLTLVQLTPVLEKVIVDLGVVPPVPSGKRTVVLVHESADDDAAMGRLIVNIRDGEIAKYLKDGGHTCLILDDDLDAPILAGLKPFNELPALYILDSATNTITHKQTAPMTGADFLAALKKGGA